MYFFSHDEIQQIAYSSEIKVATSLRGYNITPMFELLDGLNISVVLDNYCDTKRRIYLKKKGVDFGINKSMLEGGAIHSLIEKIFQIVTQNGFEQKSELIDKFNELKTDDRIMEIIWDGGRLQELKNISENKDDYLNSLNTFKEILTQLIDFEIKRIKNINGSSNDVNILELEKYVDASVFHLGTGKIDLVAIYKNKVGICDLKTGIPFGKNLDAKHQISLYSMMMENEYKIDINWGTVIFPFIKVDGEKCLREEPYKLIFPIDEEMRQNVVNELNGINELLKKDEPPRLCTKKCSSKKICEKGMIK